MSEKLQFIKVLELYEDRLKNIMNDMTRLYINVEHLQQSLNVTKEQLEGETECSS